MRQDERGSQERLAGVRGHDEALVRLARAIARRQLHHSMVFVGPKGVGKATVARALARALHCEIAPAVGCRACASCRRVDAGLHAGVEWIVPEAPGGKIKVEQARELATRVLSAPFEGDAHVVVFDPGEALTEQAWNALLKTIEEPRPGVHFVTIARGLDGILPTILSRSAVVRFGRIADEDVAAVLAEVLAAREAEASADESAAPRSRRGRNETEADADADADAGEPVEASEDEIEAPAKPSRARKSAARRDDDGKPGPVPVARRELAMRLADGSPGMAVELALDASLDVIHRLLAEAALAVQRGPAAIFAGDRGALGQTFTEATAGPATGRPARERQAVARMTELWILHLRERMRGRAGVPELAALKHAHDGGTGSLHAASLLLELQDRLERNANARLVLEHALLELDDGGARART
jgi:DNA polymerase-3 subunit delta'